MARLALIPARGGSKRIPRKNIKLFIDKPIIAYSIEVALNSGLFDRVMVSTEDQEIANIAKKYGATVPFFRSEKNADDYATTVDVIEEVLEFYTKQEVYFDQVCCIYPTAPFITSERLKEAQALLDVKDFDTVFPVLPYSFPVQRSFRLEGDRAQLRFPEYKNVRSQDLEEIFHDAGQFYFFKTGTIEKNQGLWTDNSGVIILSEMEGQDIDTKTDWKLAELKYNLLND